MTVLYLQLFSLPPPALPANRTKSSTVWQVIYWTSDRECNWILLLSSRQKEVYFFPCMFLY